MHDGRSVGKVEVEIASDIGAVDVAPDLLHQRLAVEIDPTAGRGAQQFQVVKKRGAGASPVVRPLVAAAVDRVGVDEVVERTHNFGDRRHAPHRIAFDDQHRGQPVRADPRIPVVDAASAIHKAHPPEVVAGEAGRQHAALDFVLDARTHQRRHTVQPCAQQIEHPRQQRARLGGEEIDDRLRHVGQGVAGALDTDVRGQAPRRLLADRPDAVDDVVEKAALRLQALGQHQRLQRVAAVKVQRLEVAAVADAGKVQIAGSGQGWPRIAQRLRPARDVRGTHGRRQRIPGRASFDGWVRSKRGLSLQMCGHFRTEFLRQHWVKSFPQQLYTFS
jgi:hypothetical protein